MRTTNLGREERILFDTHRDQRERILASLTYRDPVLTELGVSEEGFSVVVAL